MPYPEALINQRLHDTNIQKNYFDYRLTTSRFFRTLHEYEAITVLLSSAYSIQKKAGENKLFQLSTDMLILRRLFPHRNNSHTAAAAPASSTAKRIPFTAPDLPDPGRPELFPFSQT